MLITPGSVLHRDHGCVRCKWPLKACALCPATRRAGRARRSSRLMRLTLNIVWLEGLTGPECSQIAECGYDLPVELKKDK
jgi:hypothetical protein